MISVLIVEDDDNFAKVLAQILATCGLKVFRVSTLTEAMSEAAIQQPNVILLDLSLPDSPLDNTVRAIPEIKEMAPDSQVCVLTGHTEKGLEEKVLSMGAVSFSMKGGGMGSRQDILNILLESLRQGSKSIQENVTILEKAIGVKLT
jgi:ActR/RegA family two-component response regulator